MFKTHIFRDKISTTSKVRFEKQNFYKSRDSCNIYTLYLHSIRLLYDEYRCNKYIYI